MIKSTPNPRRNHGPLTFPFPGECPTPDLPDNSSSTGGGAEFRTAQALVELHSSGENNWVKDDQSTGVTIVHENLAREGLAQRAETTTFTTTLTAAQEATLTHQLTEATGVAVTEVRLTDVGASGAGRHVEGSHLTTENIQRQMSGGETTVVQQQGNSEVVQDVQQTLTQGEWGCFCNN